LLKRVHAPIQQLQLSIQLLVRGAAAIFFNLFQQLPA
jgi:hypothetical protein